MATDPTITPAGRQRLALGILLQCLPLLGLSGCSALWMAVPVQPFFREASALAFWAFTGAATVCALLSVVWGLGYLYLGQRERLGCALVLAGPLLVVWTYGYLFDGFIVARSDADEQVRLRAMLSTAALSAGPVLFMAWDAWRLARRRPASAHAHSTSPPSADHMGQRLDTS